MKHLIKTTIIISLLLLFTACGGDDIAENESEQENYFVKAKIDAELFNSDSPLIQYILSEPNSIVLTCHDEAKSIQIHIKNYSGSGTYTAGVGINNENGFLLINSTVYLVNNDFGTGTITINESGNIITGTFSFTGVEESNNTTKTVSEGSFRCLKLL